MVALFVANLFVPFVSDYVTCQDRRQDFAGLRKRTIKIGYFKSEWFPYGDSGFLWERALGK
jgi:hypothetical protein